MLDPKCWLEAIVSLCGFVIMVAAVFSLDVTYLSFKWRVYRNTDHHVTTWLQYREYTSAIVLLATFVRLSGAHGDWMMTTSVITYLLTTYVVVPLVERS